MQLLRNENADMKAVVDPLILLGHLLILFVCRDQPCASGNFYIMSSVASLPITFLQ